MYFLLKVVENLGGVGRRRDTTTGKAIILLSGDLHLMLSIEYRSPEHHTRSECGA